LLVSGLLLLVEALAARLVVVVVARH
jgi:hypothetical protein